MEKLKKKNERGFILVPVIGLLVVIITLSLSFNMFIERLYSTTKKRKKLLSKRIKLTSTVERILSFIAVYNNNDPVEQYAEFLEPVSNITISVEDEGGKINVNSLVNDDGEIDEKAVRFIERLFKLKQIQGEVPALLDWIDSDNDLRTSGAEKGYYNGLDYPYTPRNGAMQDISEIMLIKGFSNVSSASVLTVHSTGKININTAPHEVLVALSERMDTIIAENIIEYRRKQWFKTPSEIKNVNGVTDEIYQDIADYITVDSSVFRIAVSSRESNTDLYIECYVKKKENDVAILSWREN